jgi:hypothetical protein
MKYFLNLISIFALGAAFLTAADCDVSKAGSRAGSSAENFSNKKAATAEQKSVKPNGKRTPVLVELFTSEGCLSCPPADANLRQLAETQPVSDAEIIALSQHVDYWNQGGWRDPFSDRQFSERQSDYARFFGRSDVYTPQMIVDGTREFVGSDTRFALKQIAEAAKNEKGKIEIFIEKQTSNKIFAAVKTADLPKIADDNAANVWLAVTENDLMSNAKGGENGGRVLRHTAVVRRLVNIGVVDAKEQTLSTEIALEKNWKLENLNLAAFVQTNNGKKILGAAQVGLKSYLAGF